MGGSGGGRYILCDRCGVSTFSINMSWQYDGHTLSAARRAGWRTGIKEDWRKPRSEDVCPACIEIEKQPDTGGRR